MKIAVVGLGYVGLPLAMAMAKKYEVVGYDINITRVEELNKGFDRTNEFTAAAINEAGIFVFTANEELLSDSTVFIITVPTPLTIDKKPDLSYLIAASTTVAKYVKKGDIVIYESTVYPGCTEEECVPVLEQESGLVFNQDFFVGYSPERINPGDKQRPIQSIVEITSGSTPEVAKQVNDLYASIIDAGTYLAPSIKVAEAAKAIENAQRDVNISFMNELVLIFDKLGIDTNEVLKAAATKWNFLPFKPGLVGGHCIGVDPHYLAWKASQVGYEPKVILSGRAVNESMGVFLAEKMITQLAIQFGGNINGKRVLILGFAFKENCADTRNTKVADVYQTLVQAGLLVDVYDPLVNKEEVCKEFGIELINEPQEKYDGVVLAVAHKRILEAQRKLLATYQLITSIL
jgi:UDP-N-acetyl-D-glucosamine/UDP-N-acetyl-D-galactosamine dehydrogenase